MCKATGEFHSIRNQTKGILKCVLFCCVWSLTSAGRAAAVGNVCCWCWRSSSRIGHQGAHRHLIVIKKRHEQLVKSNTTRGTWLWFFVTLQTHTWFFLFCWSCFCLVGGSFFCVLSVFCGCVGDGLLVFVCFREEKGGNENARRKSRHRWSVPGSRAPTVAHTTDACQIRRRKGDDEEERERREVDVNRV